jgi:hypothetical protein
LQIAKLVIIEDCAPPVFARLVQTPGLLQLLESSALSPGSAKKQLQEYQLENWDTEYPGLKKALMGARYVTIADLEMLLSLKADNLELKVPAGAQFGQALVQGDAQALSSLLPDVATRNAQQALADLIEDSLTRATGPLLANCVASTLSLPVASFFAPLDARRISRKINTVLLRDDQNILVQSAARIMDIRELLEPTMANRLLTKYLDELKTSTEQPASLVETVVSLFPQIESKAQLIQMLNDRFVAWSGSLPGLTALASLADLNLSFGNDVFPSEDLVTILVQAVSPAMIDNTFNLVRSKVAFAHWKSEYGTILSRVFQTSMVNEQNQGTFSPWLHFVLKALCEKPDILNNPPESDQIVSYLPAILARSKTDEERDLTRDSIVTAAVASSPDGKAAAVSNLSAHWKSDPDQRIRRDFGIVQNFPMNDVSKLIMDSQTNGIIAEFQAPGERTLQRIQFVSEFGDLATPGFLNQRFVESLSVSTEPAYLFWEGIIRSRLDHLDQQTAMALIEAALGLVASPGSLNQRKHLLLALAIALLPKLTPVDQSAIIRRVIDLLWQSDPTIRNTAAGVIYSLRACANPGDFRIYFNAAIHEHLHKVSLSTFQQFQPVIDALVENKDLWNENSSRSIAQLAVTLSSEDSLRAPALALLESVDEFDEAEIQDVTHILQTIASTQSALSERAAKLLQRITE